MATQKPTLPSPRLKAVLRLFETQLKEGALKDKAVPEWYVMVSALVAAFEVFDHPGKLELMFDLSNSFYQAMLVWCVEASLRERRKTAVTSAPDPSQN